MKYSMLTRLLSGILVALMLLSTVACATGTEVDETSALTDAATNPSDTSDDELTETAPENEVVTDALPEDLDYKKDEIVILSRYVEGMTSGEISVEDLNSDAVNDVVYERNIAVEERLGVKINNIEEQVTDPYVITNKVATSVTAGTHEYDICAAACYVAVNQSLNSTFVDLRQSTYLDFDQPYWTQGFNDVMEYRGAQFAVTGSLLLSMYRFSFATIFNKVMFDDINEQYLYTDVENGTWTLDRQIELVSKFHRDNGNGTQDETGDTYGLATTYKISVDPYWSSCEVDIIQKDGDGLYELVFDSGKLHSVAEKLIKLFYDGEATYVFPGKGWDEEQTQIRQMFANDYAAMATIRLLEAENADIRNMTSSFGIVPMPKYDAKQEGYHTMMHDQFTVLSVPSTVKMNRLDEISAVLEAMASLSYNTLRPTYYDELLKTKIAQDPESAQMMDEVIDNIYIDAGILYGNALEYFHDAFRGIMADGTNTVASDYKAKATKAQSALTKMMRRLDRLVDEA